MSLKRIPQVATPPRRAQGFGLIELIVALTVLTVGLGAFVQGLISSSRLRQANDAARTATHSARMVAETLVSADFNEVFARYNASVADDPAGVDCPGAAFDVPGLDPHPSDVDGRVGEIRFPSSRGNGTRLTELARLSNFAGLPRDLNLDGDVLDADVTADARVLPAVVSVVWRGSTGAVQRFETTVLLGGI